MGGKACPYLVDWPGKKGTGRKHALSLSTKHVPVSFISISTIIKLAKTFINESLSSKQTQLKHGCCSPECRRPDGQQARHHHYTPLFPPPALRPSQCHGLDCAQCLLPGHPQHAPPLAGFVVCLDVHCLGLCRHGDGAYRICAWVGRGVEGGSKRRK